MKPFAFKQFQIDDLARSALHDGNVLAWDKGGGKTIAAFAWPMLKRRLAGDDTKAFFTLIVAPGSLHEQFIDEARSKFGVTLNRLGSQHDFYGDATLKARTLSRLNMGTPGTSPAAHHFYITSYTALGYNGGDQWSPREADDGKLMVSSKIIDLRKAWIQRQRIAHPNQTPITLDALAEGIGEVNKQGIKCVFIPTLATLCADEFDCVVVDEAVRMQGTESYISTGVRTLQPRFRLVGTATPVKNYLDSMFWLAHWACGAGQDPNKPNARWPYENNDGAKALFSKEFMQTERNISAEQREAKRTGRFRKIEKKIPRICNLHRLWKLLSPVVIRRRKADMNEEIVTKTFIPIRTKLGSAQHKIYSHHLKNPPQFRKDGEPMSKLAAAMTQLQMLRQAALCPDTINLGTGTRSWTDFNPKQAGILSLVEQKLSIGEQVVIMSPFQHFSDTLYQRLRQARVSCCLLDGKMEEFKRGRYAKAFKRREFSVLIGGIKSMGEGHSFSQCNNLILPSLEWAFDNNDQAIDRVHRLDSEKPVNIYVMVGENTIDERLESLFREKGDCASLALDGRLFEEKKQDVNLAELLSDAVRDFNASADTIPEQSIEVEWNALCTRLGQAEQRFKEWHPPTIEVDGIKPEQTEIMAALAALNQPAFEQQRNNMPEVEPWSVKITALLTLQNRNPWKK